MLFVRRFQPLISTIIDTGTDAALEMLRATNLLRACFWDRRHEDGPGVLYRQTRIVQLVLGAV